LTCIVLAAAVAWYQGGKPDGPRDVTDASAEPARERTPAWNALPEPRPQAPESRATPAIAEAAESPRPRGDQPLASPGDQSNPVIDPATGAAAAFRAPEDDQIASSPVGVPPADSEVDPATGATVVRRVPGDITAPASASGVLPDDVEVDSATGAATAR
jgi:hypothetical protein